MSASQAARGGIVMHPASCRPPAATVEEFGRYLRHCDPAVLAYHLPRGDFSRWITGLLADHSLGMHLAAIERDLGFRHAAELERARRRIIHAIDSGSRRLRCRGFRQRPDQDQQTRRSPQAENTAIHAVAAS